MSAIGRSHCTRAVAVRTDIVKLYFLGEVRREPMTSPGLQAVPYGTSRGFGPVHDKPGAKSAAQAVDEFHMANHTRKPSREAASPLISQFADDADMAELIEFFVGELEDRTRAISAALENGEMDQLGRMVHQIRGAAGGYGFPSISAAAGELETLLRGSEPEISAVSEKVEALIHLCQRAAGGMKGSA